LNKNRVKINQKQQNVSVFLKYHLINSGDNYMSKYLPDLPPATIHKEGDFDGFFGEIKVEPRQQKRVTLGSFTSKKIPRGFSIEILPDPDPTDSVATEIISLGTASRYKLILQLANYGSKAVKVKIWQL
jgi:hypothetical protein